MDNWLDLYSYHHHRCLSSVCATTVSFVQICRYLKEEHFILHKCTQLLILSIAFQFFFLLAEEKEPAERRLRRRWRWGKKNGEEMNISCLWATPVFYNQFALQAFPVCSYIYIALHAYKHTLSATLASPRVVPERQQTKQNWWKCDLTWWWGGSFRDLVVLLDGEGWHESGLPARLVSNLCMKGIGEWKSTGWESGRPFFIRLN